MTDVELMSMYMAVARECKAADAGVVVTMQSHGMSARFVIWAIGCDGAIKSEELNVQTTSRERLKAHVEGFIANHLAKFA